MANNTFTTGTFDGTLCAAYINSEGVPIISLCDSACVEPIAYAYPTFNAYAPCICIEACGMYFEISLESGKYEDISLYFPVDSKWEQTKERAIEFCHMAERWFADQEKEDS